MTARAGDAAPSGPPAVVRESLQGMYAGIKLRFAAFAADVGVSAGVFPSHPGRHLVRGQGC